VFDSDEIFQQSEIFPHQYFLLRSRIISGMTDSWLDRFDGFGKLTASSLTHLGPANGGSEGEIGPFIVQSSGCQPAGCIIIHKIILWMMLSFRAWPGIQVFFWCLISGCPRP